MSFTPGPEAIDPPVRRIALELYEADNLTKVADLTTDLTGTRGFTPELPGIGRFGSANFDVPLYVTTEDLSEMVPNSEVALLTRGRVVRFLLDGEIRFTAVIRPRRQQSVSTAGHAGLRRTMRMEGLLSEWDRCVMPPAPGAELFQEGDTRHFGWMSPEVDISGLDDPTYLRPVFSDGYSQPSPWIDAFGYVFDASVHRYFILDLDMEAQGLSLHMAAAHRMTAWCQSVPMGQTADQPHSAWETTSHVGVLLPGGMTRWAFEIQGLPGATDARWCATAFQINDPESGSMNGDTIKWRTGYEFGVDPYPWKASATPVGPTVKQILRSVLTQVQSEQERLLDWSIDGEDDTLDSNGNLLPRISHLPFPIGCKLGSDFLIGLARAWCDLDTAPVGKVLKTYRWRERGNYWQNPVSPPVFSDAIFAPVPGRLANVLDMTHEERIR